jgi:hypothetical protein
MALPSWTSVNGELATVEERTNVSITLPLQDTTDITVSVISGQLPPGLRIENYIIKGTPFEVGKTTDFEFVIRASNAEGIADRTYKIIVNGADEPVWQTAEGALPLLKTFRNQYWVDTLNTNWGIKASEDSVWNDVTVTVVENIPSREEGEAGDWVFVSSIEQVWTKIISRWYRANENSVQGLFGPDFTISVGDTVPNPNIDELWFNTNKDNNGLNLALKRWDEDKQVWAPQKYTVSKSAPISPFDEQIWVQVFDDTFDFVLKSYDANDRTWEIIKFVEYGPTPPDRLNTAFFVLDSAPVDFQLQAIDSDLRAGQTLNYYIAQDDGELPPGLTLSTDGKISGFVDPILGLDVFADQGYDIDPFDSAPSDLFVVDDNGFDSYFYDTTFYGFSERTRLPKKLNRNYTFTVTVEDDTSFSKREFSIYVVGDDFLRADNTIMKAGTGLFTADNTFLRNPIWLTPGNLGVKRANNYTTLYLDVYDPNALLGEISYNIQPFNDDGTESELPPGLVLDGLTGELAGIIPYQPAVSKEYKFTVEALRQFVDTDDIEEVTTSIIEDTLSGVTSLKINKISNNVDDDGVTDLEKLIGQEISIDNKGYVIETVDGDPAEYDVLNLARELEPSYKYKRLRTAFKNRIGQNYIYFIDELDGREEVWKNRKLNYSTSESYQLLDDSTDIIPGSTTAKIWHKMVRYTITAADSAGNLEFNYGAIGLNDPGLETLDDIEAALEAWLSSQGIDTENLYHLEELDDKIIAFDIPRNSAVENVILNQNLFHTDDSVLDNIEITRSRQFFKVFIDNNLQRQYLLSNNENELSGVQITLGAQADTLITKRINVTQNEDISTIKTFTINVIGEVESTINWITDANLGTLVANRPSYIQLQATTTLAGANLRFDLIDGKLPNGLELKTDGEIVGKAKQFPDSNGLGLTTIDSRNITFDGGTTSFDREFKFRVMARDRFGYSAEIREFTLNVIDTDNKVYSNVYIKPFLKSTQRTAFNNFINDFDIFKPEYIYRPYDESFGVQKDLRTLVYAGIEAKSLRNFAATVTLNHKRKSFYFGELKSAIAKVQGTNDVLYEVVYVEIKDPLQPTVGNTELYVQSRKANKLSINSVKLEIKDDTTAAEEGAELYAITMREGDPVKFAAVSNRITIFGRTVDYSIDATGQIEIVLQSGDVVVLRPSSSLTSDSGDPFRFRPDGDAISVDNTGIQASQSQNVKRWISNIGNMRKRINDIGANDREFLPLWMRTSQEELGNELDYVTAMPLCFVKPGFSQTVIENIQNAQFDFAQLHYDIDRYIVDRTEESDQEQFIVFGDYKLNV